MKQSSFIESTFSDKNEFEQFVKKMSSIDVSDHRDAGEDEEGEEIVDRGGDGREARGYAAGGLKSGVVLCNLLNKIKPGSCPKPQNKKLPFVQRENIVTT